MGYIPCYSKFETSITNSLLFESSTIFSFEKPHGNLLLYPRATLSTKFFPPQKKPTDLEEFGGILQGWPLRGIFGPVEDIARGTWGSWSGERFGEGEVRFWEPRGWNLCKWMPRFHCEKGKPCEFLRWLDHPLVNLKTRYNNMGMQKNQAEKWKRWLKHMVFG